MRRVVCAALKDLTGQIILGARHYDKLMRESLIKLPSYTEPIEQGFIDQHGVFMNRLEAWQVANSANQIIRRVGGDDGILYSENLY